MKFQFISELFGHFSIKLLILFKKQNNTLLLPSESDQR